MKRDQGNSDTTRNWRMQTRFKSLPVEVGPTELHGKKLSVLAVYWRVELNIDVDVVSGKKSSSENFQLEPLPLACLVTHAKISKPTKRLAYRPIIFSLLIHKHD